MAIRKLSVTNIISHIDLFLANEPVRQLAAAFLDRVYENRQVYLFSCGDWLRYRISGLAHPELWLINAQAMNRIFAFNPVVELAAHIAVSEHEAVKLLGDVNYAYSCGPDIAQAVAETWEIEQLFAEKTSSCAWIRCRVHRKGRLLGDNHPQSHNKRGRKHKPHNKRDQKPKSQHNKRYRRTIRLNDAIVRDT